MTHQLQHDISELETIKTRIEQMNKTQHIEILKMLQENSGVKLNENKSGVYINLSFLPATAIQSIREYLEYIHDQETSLGDLEAQKTDYKKTFFQEKENKDNDSLFFTK
jgi:hypothetical protein